MLHPKAHLLMEINNHKNKSQQRHNKCRSFCCGGGGSRLSVSSSGSADNSHAHSSFAHAMVQARLQQMIDCGNNGRRRRCVVLVAVDMSSHDPGEDFRATMSEVIAAEGMAEPRELRRLLDCYLAVNSTELRPAILEAFYEVCCSLFS